MKKMIKYASLLLLVVLSSGCGDYLNVVPDKTQEITLLFERRESAYRALSTCYHYIPKFENTYGIIGASDEIIMNEQRITPGKNAIMGVLTADYPVMSYWSGDISTWDALGKTEASSLFIALRVCNTFLENINMVPDMTQTEISRWTAEVKVLKAYYHFLLFSQYGAIPLMKENTPIGATGNELMVKRQPVDEVVKYIVELLEEAEQGIPKKVTSTAELGRIDGVIVKALKARVLLYAASPLFNNNPAYASLKDKDGVLLFSPGDANTERQKWVNAAEAFKTAIETAELNGSMLYTFNGTVPEYDEANYANDPDRVPYMYNFQYMIVQKWNKEVIWGLSRVETDWWEVQRGANIKIKGESSGDAWQWLNPTMTSAEFFYTKNGLPMEEDPNYDYENRYELTTIGEDHASVAIPAEQTIKMHLNREPRFYASLAFDRSRTRVYGGLYDMKLRYGEDNGAKSPTEVDITVSGYFLRKLIHPDTKGTSANITRYPWPIIRLGELYLGYAEALNEAYGEEKQDEVLKYLNFIRERSGVPTVEKAWANAKRKDLYKTKDGMREVIQRERTIELSYEAFRNDDVRRWLKGDAFNAPTYSWNSRDNVNGSTAEGYYKMVEDKKLLQVFSSRNYLWPIPTSELVNNSNLVQNPGY